MVGFSVMSAHVCQPGALQGISSLEVPSPTRQGFHKGCRGGLAWEQNHGGHWVDTFACLKDLQGLPDLCASGDPGF